MLSVSYEQGNGPCGRFRFKIVFEAIRQLMAPPETKKKKIGFMVKEKKAAYGRRGVKRKKG